MESSEDGAPHDARAEAVDRIAESFEQDAAAHTRANPAAQHPLPDGVEFASPVRRLAAWALEVILFIVTLGIGWSIWALSMGDAGQTPAKKILGLRVLLNDQARSAGLSRMLLLRWFAGALLVPLVATITLGIILLMPFWDPRNRNLWDWISSCVVVYDPDGRWEGHGERIVPHPGPGPRHR